MLPKISLCIPTADRYRLFLSKALPVYLRIPQITDIVIVDENGNDKAAIETDFEDEVAMGKIRVYENDRRLGAFKNKIKAISLALNDWVCVFDSDNLLSKEYFSAFDAFQATTTLDPSTIYCPAYALANYKPHENFDFTHLLNEKIDKQFIQKTASDNFSRIEILLNTGNYILHKYALEFPYEKFEKQIKACRGYDVIFFNYLMTYHKNYSLQVVPNMKYNHAVHDGSYFLNTYKIKETQDFYDKLCQLIVQSEDA
jgi:glycosyltransferase involved in cell wall biosynthesis